MRAAFSYIPACSAFEFTSLNVSEIMAISKLNITIMLNKVQAKKKKRTIKGATLPI